MDHSALLVWIDNNALSERELAGILCRRHADALVVPRGWTIDDRRDPIPRLFRAIAAEADQQVAARRPAQKKAPLAREEPPSLFEQQSIEDSDPDNPETVSPVVADDDQPAENAGAASQETVVSDSVEFTDDVHHADGDITELEADEIAELIYDADEHVDVPLDDDFISSDRDLTPADGLMIPEDDAIDEPADPDETQAMPWSPRLTGKYSPDDTGPVSGRLLGRAFGARLGEE